MTAELEPMPVLRIGDPTWSVPVDSYAWERDRGENRGGENYMKLWFISLIGAEDNCKFVWANLIKGDTGTLMFEGRGRNRFVRLSPAPIDHTCKHSGKADSEVKCKCAAQKGYWKRLTKSLPNASSWQYVLLPEPARYDVARHDFLLMPGTVEEAPYWHMRYMRKRLPTPLHSSWMNWLWERALQLGEVRLLDGSGVLMYRCEPDAARLSHDVSEAVRYGYLRVEDTAAQPQSKSQFADSNRVRLAAQAA